MSFQVSPGVEVREQDRAGVIPAVSISRAGYVGHFRWGPVNKIVRVNSENVLVDKFGTPSRLSPELTRSFTSASLFLQYGNDLRVVRAIDNDGSSGATNASSNGDGVLILNEDTFDPDNAVAPVYARYPGDIGNSLRVVIGHADITGNESTPEVASLIKNNFSFLPGTSEWATAEGETENDEVHILVIDKNGEFSGTRGAVLERFEGLSLHPDAKNSIGESIYVLDRVNLSSRYILLGNEFLAKFPEDNNEFEFDGDDSLELTDGTDGDTTPAGVIAGISVFENVEEVDLSSSIFTETNGTWDPSEQKSVDEALISLAIARRDVIPCFDAPLSVAQLPTLNAKADAVLAKFADYPSTSFAVYGAGIFSAYNRFTDQIITVSGNAITAGLIAQVGLTDEPWFSPAGLNRGVVRGVTQLLFNPSKNIRDDLYQNRINSYVAFAGQGIVLYGDKTGLSRPSPLDRINVRRLMIVLEKAISLAAKYQLFELNDEITRSIFRNLVEPFLRQVQARRGLLEFRVICDSSNNTDQVIASNGFVAEIRVRPATSINFIRLVTNITRGNIDFEETIATTI